MDDECILDYETRSRADLTLLGPTGYAEHSSTSIFCIAYKCDDAPIRLWIPERAPMPRDLWVAFQFGVLVAHNASFERAITRLVLPKYPLVTEEQKLVLRSIPSSRWRCTAAKAARCQLPRSLEMAGKVMELPTQKDMSGNRLVRKYSRPRKPSKNNPSHWWSDKKDLRAIYRYCIKDVQAEWELDQALPDLSDYEQKVWELDQKINDRGVLIDICTVKIILKLIAQEMHNIQKQVQILSRGTIQSATQRAQVLKWLNERGAELPNLTAPTIRDKLLTDLHPRVRQMLEYRQASSRTSTGKYIAMLSGVCEDSRARELLLYAGANPTDRWSGKRLQPQNFPRPTLKDFDSDSAVSLIKKGDLKLLKAKYGETKAMDVLVSVIRGMLVPSPEKEFYCADFAAIEARIAFWVAEHEDGIKAFEEGRKLYEEMASSAFGIPLEEVKKESLERFVGKESVLGCQYGLGPRKFLSNCHRKGVSQVTQEMAKKAVYAYRNIHYPIPRLWRALEQAVIEAIQCPGKKFKTNKVTIYVHAPFLVVQLPSGRKMRYFKPRLANKQIRGRMVPEIRYSTMDHFQWREVAIWGGVFTNHVVQGISRDLMVNAAMNIENAGYEFVLSVHDEGLAERTIGEGNVKEFISLMTDIPTWAQGAPVTAEGWAGPRYRK